jgi:hypothetical protein
MPARTIRRDVRLAVLALHASAAEATLPTTGAAAEQAPAPTPAQVRYPPADASLATRVQQAASSGQNLTTALEALASRLTAADCPGLAGAEWTALQQMLHALQTTITPLLAALESEEG